jgi:hypothetical protein
MNEETKSGKAGALSAEAATVADVRAENSVSPAEVASRPLPEDALIILPVRNVVLFPGLVIPLDRRARSFPRGGAGGRAPRATDWRATAKQA